MRTFREILEDAGYECSAYSGRGMSGEECLSITLDDDDRMGRFFADVVGAVLPDEKVDVALAFCRMRTDSLGRGIVVYFPGVKFEE